VTETRVPDIVSVSVPPPIHVTAIVGTLPGFACSLGPGAPVSEAVDAMNAELELPGIIVGLPGGGINVLSRTKLFETLGHPYGRAVFLNRPVAMLFDETSAKPLIVDRNADLAGTVRRAMNRDASARYDPLVVKDEDGYRLIDLRVLLLAQSAMLTESATIVTRQAELALALSGTLDLEAVLALVLESILELVPYKRAVIYMTGDEGLVKAAERFGPFGDGASCPPDLTGGAVRNGEVAPPTVFRDDDGWTTFPLTKGGHSLGYLCVQRSGNDETPGWREIVGSFAASAAIAVSNARMYSRLESMASVDQLTSLLNRRAFMSEAIRIMEKAARDERPVSAIMLDIDRFKKINDGYGHAAGDEVLRATAARLQNELRAGDIAGRFGGEEFVILLADTEKASAGVVAERIRARLAAAPIQCSSGAIPMTASLGIATKPPRATEPLAALIDRADAAMYRAKRAGRNRVRFAEAVDAPGEKKEALPHDFTALDRRKNADLPALAAGPESMSDPCLDCVSSILEAISFGEPFPELAARALDRIRTARPDSAVTLLMRVPGGDALRIVVQRGLSDDILGKTLALGQSFAGRSALERRVVLADKQSILLEAPELGLVMEAGGFTQFRAYPLTAPGAALGVLEVFERDQSPAPSRGLSAVASALAAAASSSSLVDDARRQTLDLEAAYDTTLASWVRMLELRDQETEGHSRRVTAMTVELAAAFGVPSDRLNDLKRGALLHDIGKMGVPDSILLKPDRLNADEQERMRLHPAYAYDVIRTIPFLAKAVDIPYGHHERWDGSGYPRGLAGRAIPLAARLFAVVDVWDALRSDRPYRAALNAEKAAAIIAAGAGSQFDPDVVAVFLDLRREEISG